MGKIELTMTSVNFYTSDYEPKVPLTYSVISARYRNKWVFVRHHLRDTFEIPGGHIEKGETAEQAAGRELHEETGAVGFSLECIATYSVTIDGETGWGRLYLALIEELGPIPDISEIAEVTVTETLPEKVTHPLIQPHLFSRTVEYLKQREGKF